MSKTDAQAPGNGAERAGNIVELPRNEKKHVGNTVTDFVRDHPLLLVAGGVAVGAVAAALLPRGTGRGLARRAAGLARAAGTAGALLGTRVLETAEAAGAGLRERGGVVADRMERLGENASGRIGKLGDAASARVERLIDPVEGAASRVAKKAAELRSRVRH